MITVEHLTKYYGDYLAVNDLSFEIPGGHVYGFLGPNGAGKSTTMNIMTGCLSATEGSILIDGHDIFEEPKEAKRLIGYLPEQPPLYLNESPLDYLTFVGRAKGLRGEELAHQIQNVIEQTGLSQVKHRRISALSKGYKQRVGIAQALLGNPHVIILDEPTVGLDPLQIIEIRDLIKKLGETHTVIFSSHILSEVQAICDEILMIAKGRLVAFDTPENLEKQLVSCNELILITDAPAEDALALVKKLDDVMEVTTEEREDGYLALRIQTELSELYELSGPVFHAFADAGYTLFEMNGKKVNLEDIFLELAEVQSEASMDDETAANQAEQNETRGAEEMNSNPHAEETRKEEDEE